MKLAKKPIYLVITKCDTKSKGDLEAAKAYISDNCELPIKQIVDLLKQNGYDGFFSLEWESLWRDELKKLDWSVDKILKEYIDFMDKI